MNNPSPSKKHEIAARRSRIAALRLAGHNDQGAIAAELGVSQPTVSRDFAALDEVFREQAAADTALLKGLQYARTEDLLRALWADATSDTDGRNWAVDRALAVLARQAALMGLDAPAKRELSGGLENTTLIREYAVPVDEV